MFEDANIIAVCVSVIILGKIYRHSTQNLLRIKQIVLATKTQRHIFFLLDEIFKGTNSQDRHAWSKSADPTIGQGRRDGNGLNA